jgi:N-formylglutamate amidohydrolase
LGTIPRIVGEGQDIYRSRLPAEQALARIESIHRPYHRKLKEILQATRTRFGVAYLIDCHSMPSASLGPHADNQADIVLGDRYGTSCASVVVDVFQECLEDLGFRVARNKPYAGGYITEHYGHPRSDVHALQVEINRALYLDESRVEKGPGFAEVQTRLMSAIANATHRLTFGAQSYPLAAE